MIIIIYFFFLLLIVAARMRTPPDTRNTRGDALAHVQRDVYTLRRSLDAVITITIGRRRGARTQGVRNCRRVGDLREIVNSDFVVRFVRYTCRTQPAVTNTPYYT